MTQPPHGTGLRAWLELVRPPNVATALADVLAGFGVAGLSDWRALPWLLVATAGLYAGGVTLNDVFDRDLDRQERPERPIPSGRVSTAGAATLAATLLTLGVAAATVAGRLPGLVALVIAALVVAYDAWGKHSPVLGPLNMGLCRGANLLLGVAVSAPVLVSAWPLAAIPTIYIAAVTLLSRGEVSGGARSPARLALTLLVLVLGALTVLSARAEPPSIVGFLLTGLLAARILPAFYRAIQSPDAGVIRQAVGTGVLSLVLLDGVLATVYAGMIYGLALLATAFVAVRLARMFAVT